MSNQGKAISIKLPAVRADLQGQPVDTLVEQLLGRWNGRGAPDAVLAKAARVNRDFRTLHASVRHDRQFVSNLGFLAASLGGLGVVTIGMTLAELPISSGELLSRMLVLGLLIGACVSIATRSSQRLSLQIAILGAFLAILFASPPSDFALRGWDRTSMIIGAALIAAKAMRLFADRLLDRHEARLLLKAAGRR
jgi:hypothetical protein